MRTIPLTQGKIALVDDADYEWLNQWNWYANKCGNTFYAVRYIGGGRKNPKCVSMHRVILNTPDGNLTDHRNHNGLDNQRANIRNCTHAQNTQSQTSHSGTSKHKGVYWNKKAQKWIAHICCNYKRYHLGCFSNEVDAALAYDRAATELFGEFALTNF